MARASGLGPPAQAALSSSPLTLACASAARDPSDGSSSGRAPSRPWYALESKEVLETTGLLKFKRLRDGVLPSRHHGPSWAPHRATEAAQAAGRARTTGHGPSTAPVVAPEARPWRQDGPGGRVPDPAPTDPTSRPVHGAEAAATGCLSLLRGEGSNRTARGQWGQPTA